MRSTPAPRVSLGTKWLRECEASTEMIWAAAKRVSVVTTAITVAGNFTRSLQMSKEDSK
jgi:hypothetical protein